MAANGPIFSWGQFVFSLTTLPLEKTAQKRAWRWPATNRIGAEPKRQFLGPESETRGFDGLYLPEWFGGADQLERLRRLGDRGRPQTLLDGTGRNLGAWCLLSVDETGDSWLAETSIGREVTFRLELARYGDDASEAGIAGYAGQALPTTAEIVAEDVSGVIAGALRGLFSL